MISIDSKTKIVGLLGYPLGHSLSPVMQNTAFSDKNINMVYIPIEVKPNNFDTVVKAISKMNFAGFNITKPFKIEIIKHIDELDESAKCIGAVNTVVIKNERFIGYNTDGIGFLRSLEEGLGSNIEGKNIFVLGSGGAARAICTVLAFHKAKKVCICNRTYEKAFALSTDINSYIPYSTFAIPMEYNEMKKSMQDVDVFINTTNVGIFPEAHEMPIDSSLLNNKLTVCDVIYNPRKTKLLLEAEKLGCKTISGLGMLVYQGAEAFKLWTGIEAPVELMFKVVSEGLGFK